MGLTSSGMTPVGLAMTVFTVVTVCTLVVVIIGVLIDKSAAGHERNGGR